MLKINNKKCEIIEEKLRFVDALYNSIKCYSPLIDIIFNSNNKKGYICFYIGFMDNTNPINLENKKYISNPFCNELLHLMEICYDDQFIDDVDSDVTVIFNKCNNNKMDTKFYINDKLIKVEYNGLLNVMK